MKILFLAPYAPTRVRTRPHNFIKFLGEAGHEVTVATLWTDPGEQRQVQDTFGKRTTLLGEGITRLESYRNCLIALPGKRPLQSVYSWSNLLTVRLSELMAAAPPDIVHVEHLRGARYGLWIKNMFRKTGRPETPVVWDSVDCISSLLGRAAREGATWHARVLARLELARTQRYEAFLVHQFGATLVTSEVDRQQLLALARSFPPARAVESLPPLEKRVKVVPNGVDLGYFEPSGEPRDEETLVISGKMSYHANVAAVTRFVREAMPLIWAAHPRVRLWIVGKDPTSEIRRLGAAVSSPELTPNTSGERILVTGTVADIRPFLRRATLAVAPICYGAGIQNKVLEAMACGTPIAATREAVAGLPPRPGFPIRVSDNLQDLARSVTFLLNSPAERRFLSEAGRRFVEDNYDWRSAVRLLQETYGQARPGEAFRPARAIQGTSGN